MTKKTNATEVIRIFEESRALLQPYIEKLNDYECRLLIYSLIRHAFNGEMMMNGQCPISAAYSMKFVIDQAVVSYLALRAKNIDVYSEDGQELLSAIAQNKIN